MFYPIIFLMTALFLSPISYAQQYQGDASLGKLKVPSCGFCHGNDGIATNESYPNLAGQKQAYLMQSMLDYQAKQRTGPMAAMMTQQLSRLSNEDLADIAAFYAAMESEQ